jgi:hypothetical protein
MPHIGFHECCNHIWLPSRGWSVIGFVKGATRAQVVRQKYGIGTENGKTWVMTKISDGCDHSVSIKKNM